MMKVIRKAFPLFFSCVLFFSAEGQVRREYQSWWTIGCEKKISERWTAALKVESRIDMDAAMFVNDFANLSFKRKWTEAFSTEFHYRYSIRNQGGGNYIDAHRFMADFNYRVAIQKTDVVFRVRFGREDEALRSQDFFTFDENVVRQKIGLKRKIGELEWTISAEQFETIGPQGVDFDQFRVVLNASYRITKRHGVDVFVMHQDMVSTVRTNFGAAYTYKLKSRKQDP
jgi:hypothetical protein